MIPLIVALAVAQAATVAPADDQRAAFDARYAALRVAMDSRDPNKIAALFTPDYLGVEVDGSTSDLKETIAQLTRMDPIPADTVRTTRVLAVRPTADGADVDQRYERIWSVNGVTRRFVALSLDHWVRTGTIWRLQRSTTRSMAGYENGKLVGRRPPD